MVKKKAKRKRPMGGIALLASAALLLSGCGAGEAGTGSETGPGGAADGPLTAAQWQNGFLETAALPDDSIPYYEIRRSDFTEPETEGALGETKEISAYAWNARYVLSGVMEQGEEKFFISVQKKDQEPGENREILNDWPEKPQGYAVCMDVVSEDRIAVLFAETTENRQGEILAYYLVNLNGGGEYQDSKEVTAVYKEASSQGWNGGFESWWCDPDGYQCLVINGSRLIVANDSGEKILDRDGQERIITAFHMPDGSLVLSRYSEERGKTELVWTEFSDGTEQVLWTYQGILASRFTVTPEGTLYYIASDVLTGWDLKTGTRRRLFSFSGTGVSPDNGMGGSICCVTLGEEKEILVHLQDLGETMVLTDVLAEDEEGIVVADLVGGQNLTRACVTKFNEQKGTQVLQVETNMDWARVSAEIAAGKGPDIMVLYREEMQALQNLGALEPLDDYLDPELEKQVFNSVREACSMDGKWYAVTPDIWVLSLFTTDEIWGKDSWTLQDILDIVEERELEGLIFDEYGNGSAGLNLMFLGGFHFGGSLFHDQEKGECHFESQDFIRLLELCKQYGKTGNVSRQEMSRLLLEGKILAWESYFLTLNQYSQIRSDPPEKLHYVSYPGQTGHAGSFHSFRYVVVNRNAKDKETIGEFLNMMLSGETQLQIVTSRDLGVNKELIEDSVHASSWDGEVHWMVRVPDGNYELDKRADGSNYLEEFIEFVDQVEVFFTPEEDPVWKIVEEETQAYWDGQKDAEETAEIIDNRVQLYLDETGT